MNETRVFLENHGITVTQRSVYRYDGYTYDNLSDALNYAETVRTRATETAAREAGAHPRAERQ